MVFEKKFHWLGGPREHPRQALVVGGALHPGFTLFRIPPHLANLCFCLARAPPSLISDSLTCPVRFWISDRLGAEEAAAIERDRGGPHPAGVPTKRPLLSLFWCGCRRCYVTSNCRECWIPVPPGSLAPGARPGSATQLNTLTRSVLRGPVPVVHRLEVKLETVRKKIRRTQHQASYWRSKSTRQAAEIERLKHDLATERSRHTLTKAHRTRFASLS